MPAPSDIEATVRQSPRVDHARHPRRRHKQTLAGAAQTSSGDTSKGSNVRVDVRDALSKRTPLSTGRPCRSRAGRGIYRLILQRILILQCKSEVWGMVEV